MAQTPHLRLNSWGGALWARAPAWMAVLACAAVLVLLSPASTAQDSTDQDYGELSLEELMGIEVEVTSVSRKAEKLSETAAAIFVLTSEDIRRSGATSIPEALRMVPGVHVARVNSSTWAVGIRGFNGQFSNKLLVLIDGRRVYTPSFSGVHWDVQDVLLEDVERIEVIRGPGAVAWGANAVNGVINVITKDAFATQGNLGSLLLGTEDRWILSARHGGTLGENGAWRGWAKAFSRDEQRTFSGASGDDAWRMVRGGFRYDGEVDPGETLTVQAEAYQGDADFVGRVASVATPPFALFPADQDMSGGHALVRYTAELSDSSDVQLQAYLDSTRRNTPFGDQDVDMADVEFTHHVELSDRHDVVWGLNSRLVDSRMGSGSGVGFLDPNRLDRLNSGFFQYEYEAVPDTLNLIAGAKLEDSSAGGTSLLPMARFVYTPTSERTFWGSVSKAARTPSLAETSIVLPAFVIPPPPVTVVASLVGNQDLDSERLTAFELGWRERLSDRVSVDATVFHNDYNDLFSTESGAPAPIGPGVFGVILTPQNQRSGDSTGFEVSATLDVNDAWQLAGAYSYIHLDIDTDSSSNDTSPTAADRAPSNLINLRSHHVLTEDASLDLLAYHVASVDEFNVDSYVRLDANFTYRISEATLLQAGVVNLLHDDDLEWGGEYTNPANSVQRAGFLKLTHRF